eukprot:7671450-Alexandrium_andersonii.AAC.1
MCRRDSGKGGRDRSWTPMSAAQGPTRTRTNPPSSRRAPFCSQAVGRHLPTVALQTPKTATRRACAVGARR